jgi:PEP-CTERM motif
MKRNIFIAVLGMGSMAVAYGQGQVDFSNYTSSSAPKVTFGGVTIGDTFNAELLYYVGTSASDKPTSAAQMTTLASSVVPFGLAGGDANGSTYAGWFEGGLVTIPGVSAANNLFVSFEILAFQGASYANATVLGNSSIFQSPVTGTSLDSPGGFTPGSWQNFTVQAVPEPTTLALAGLGGLASLVALRRKQA